MLKIKGAFSIAFILLAQWVWAQSDLMVQGTSPDLYLVHTVQPKETWFSVGRLYNITPKEVATLNNVTMDKLAIGQQLKIPLNPANFSQDGKKKPDEVFVPVYHTVQEKEWMYRISQNHNKVPIESLQKWNNINNDQLKAGMKLVVGYLKVKTAQSPLAANGLKKLIPAAGTTAAAGTTTTATQTVAKNETPADQKKEEVKKEEPKKEDVKKEDPKKEEAKKEEPKKEEPKETTPPTVTKPSTTSAETTTDAGSYAGFKGGYFKSSYSGNGGKSTAGNAGIFRSTSGWKDGKYYALMNNVPVGTIVKVTYSSTSKTIYAKVLGQLPDMKESVGLTIRISDAAAAELGAELGKFYVDIVY